MFHGDCFVRDMPPGFDSVNRKRFDAIDGALTIRVLDE